jgi:hypothetical protein
LSNSINLVKHSQSHSWHSEAQSFNEKTKLKCAVPILLLYRCECSNEWALVENAVAPAACILCNLYPVFPCAQEDAADHEGILDDRLTNQD